MSDHLLLSHLPRDEGNNYATSNAIDMRNYCGVLAASLVILSGCTTALVSKPIGIDTPEPVNGLMYRLPKKQFDFTVTYELESCSVESGSDDIQLETKVTGTVAESIVGDDTQTYYLDYAQLTAPTKVSKIDVNISDTGVLTSINSVATDQTGTIITNVGSTVLSIAGAAVLPLRRVAAVTVPYSLTEDSLAMMSPRLLGNLTTSDSVTRRKVVSKNICANFDKTKQAYETAKDAAKSAENLLKQRSDALDVLTQRKAMEAQLKDEQSFYKQYGTKAQYDNATAALQTSTKALDAAQRDVNALSSAVALSDVTNKKLAALKAKLIIDQTFTFAPSIQQQRLSAPLQFSRINSLFDPSIRACIDATEQNCLRLPSVTVLAEASSGKGPVYSKLTDNPGVVYRLPATARLVACTGDGAVFIDQITQIPQYGYIASLSLRNGPFADNLLKVSFNANGIPSQLSFASQSQGEAASKTASETAQSYLNFAKSRQQDRIDAAKTQITLDKERASGNASVASDNLNALRDIQKLQALGTGTSSSADNQLTSLNSQRDILEVQLKILALQKQINDAKTNLAASSGQ